MLSTLKEYVFFLVNSYKIDYLIFLLWLVFLVSYIRTFLNQGHGDLAVCFILRVSYLAVTLQVWIHCDLIFVNAVS